MLGKVLVNGDGLSSTVCSPIDGCERHFCQSGNILVAETGGFFQFLLCAGLVAGLEQCDSTHVTGNLSRRNRGVFVRNGLELLLCSLVPVSDAGECWEIGRASC